MSDVMEMAGRLEARAAAAPTPFHWQAVDLREAAAVLRAEHEARVKAEGSNRALVMNASGMKRELEKRAAYAEARALAAETALAEAVAALEPFDDALGEDSDGYADTLLITMKYGACTDYSLCVGNLRAARAIRSRKETQP